MMHTATADRDGTKDMGGRGASPIHRIAGYWLTGRYDMDATLTSQDIKGTRGRSVVAVIGIDHYRHWPKLSNAVQDATGVEAMFRRLGFESIAAPLLDERATGQAIREFVTDDLMALGPEDSLLFYAGHGGTRRQRPGGEEIKTGYLIPVDASDSPNKVGTWIELDGWLRAVSRLSAKHILVIVDACHSGIALDPILKWRDIQSWQVTPLSVLQARRSRRIITSALDDQVAGDSGPIVGHSLFTGCLIEGLTHGIRHGGSEITTGSELGLYVQRRVGTYPNTRQTPDFGTFDFDDRGEMSIPLLTESRCTNSVGSKVDSGGSEIGMVAPHLAPASAPGSRNRVRRIRRRVAIGVASAAAAFAVLGDRVFGGESSQPGARFDRPTIADPSSVLHDEAGRCAAGMVSVPAGLYDMGSREGDGEADEYPQHEVALSAYCIDETEVTVKAYAACAAAGGCSAAPLTVHWSGVSNDDVRLWSPLCNRDDHADHPINCVDWDQAAAYCKWRGKRLPTEAEWEYAARGNDGRIYPWGNDAPNARLLNGCGSECVAMGTRDLKRDLVAMYDGNDGWETTAPVGSFRAGVSPFGALDMAGNVWEWTADWYGDYPRDAVMNPLGASTGKVRVMRGGGWFIFVAGNVRAANRNTLVSTIRFNNVGFRCAHDH